MPAVMTITDSLGDMVNPVSLVDSGGASWLRACSDLLCSLQQPVEGEELTPAGPPPRAALVAELVAAATPLRLFGISQCSSSGISSMEYSRHMIATVVQLHHIVALLTSPPSIHFRQL